ncbi:hypothetical protein [Saccharopolyspora pogona]|uniref:hypothetical protein n=1 Tax=Saccharopolyspora pogona TaxID=333966 RepID=UPI0016867C42|nr:hypothetical protein [Saccharopolyspora pogona]
MSSGWTPPSRARWTTSTTCSPKPTMRREVYWSNDPGSWSPYAADDRWASLADHLARGTGG